MTGQEDQPEKSSVKKCYRLELIRAENLNLFRILTPFPTSAAPEIILIEIPFGLDYEQGAFISNYMFTVHGKMTSTTLQKSLISGENLVFCSVALIIGKS